MLKRRSAAVLIIGWLSLFAQATGYTGTFPIQGNTGQALNLQEDAQGSLQGSLTGNGIRFQLQGTVQQNNVVVGYVYDAQGNPAAYFLMQLQGNALIFQMGDIDGYGNPLGDPTTTLTFLKPTPQVPQTPGQGPQVTPPQASVPAQPNAPQLPQTQASSGPLQGTEVQVGQLYPGGTSLKVSSMGVSLTLPGDWQGTVLQQGENPLLLGSNTEPGLLLIQTLLGADLRTLQGLLEAPQVVSDQLVLQPVGGVQQQGNTLSIQYRDATGQTHGQATVVTDGTASVLFFYVSTPQNAQVGQRVTGQLVSSTRFAPGTLQQAVQKVKQDFTGKKLYNFSFKGNATYSSESTSIYHLCSSGQYRFEGSGESSWSVPAGLGGSQSVNSSEGFWQVVALNGQVHLALFPSQGPVKSLRVDHNGKEYTLGGKEHTVNPSPLCN